MSGDAYMIESELLEVHTYIIRITYEYIYIYIFFLLKEGQSGTRPVAQRLSSHVLLLGGPGFAGSDPVCRNGTTWHTSCGRRPTYKVEKDGHNVSSGQGFLSKMRRTGSS